MNEANGMMLSSLIFHSENNHIISEFFWINRFIFHVLTECKKKFESGLGKQLRELSDDKFTALVTDYFCDWQFLEKTNNGYFVCDGIYKTAGKFPEDYQLSD